MVNKTKKTINQSMAKRDIGTAIELGQDIDKDTHRIR